MPGCSVDVMTGKFLLQLVFFYSAMNDVINKKTNRMNVSTFAAIQTVKYNLRAENETSINRYKRLNFLRSPINRDQCRKMQLSRKAYEDKLADEREKRKKVQQDYDLQPAAKKRKKTVHEQAKSLKEKLLSK